MKRTREDGHPKPRELKPSVKRLIIHRAITERKVPREFLANQLIKEIEEAGEIPPTRETAKRYISRARNTENPLDEPWNIGCCSQYSNYFPPESIPFLSECKQLIQDALSQKIANSCESEYTFRVSESAFSIRLAMWIVRLKPIIDKIFADFISSDPDAHVGLPFALALIYSYAELSSEIIGEDNFDSSDLDAALFSGDLETLGQKGIRDSMLKSTKLFYCDNNCELCRYQKFAPGNCTPKQKDGEK